MKDIYFKALSDKGFNFSSIDEVVEFYLSTLLETNKTYDFFVDWEKVKSFVEKNKIEINILSSLIRCRDFDFELKNILRKYPEVLKVVPLLLAVKESDISVISDLSLNDIKISRYNFRKESLSDEEIDFYIEFFDKTGLKNFLLNIVDRSLVDYLLGVEVGIDTNTRKNRSGKFLEMLLKPLLEKISKRLGYDIFIQKQFSYLKSYGLGIGELSERKADFILVKYFSEMKKYKVIDIEVNFYNVAGSKPQEIVDSYIERRNELSRYGYEFILITDGIAWKRQVNQLRKAFENLDYVLNVKLVNLGILERLLYLMRDFNQ